MKPYCTQNNGDCSNCSLVNYGRDCQNNPVWGGKREGAGRKPSGKKARQIYVTDDEYQKIKDYLDSLRQA
jgi:hypothetical protein